MTFPCIVALWNKTVAPSFFHRSTMQMAVSQPRAQASSAISDVTSPVKLVGKIRRVRYRIRFQASVGNSDSAN